MGNWRTAKLTEMADYINGFAFKPSDFTEEGVPIIRIEQLKNPNGNFDYFDGKIPERNWIDNEDLIFSWSASLFLKIWQHGFSYLNQHLFKVLPKEGVDKYFLKYLLESSIESLVKMSHGSTIQHITRKELQKFEVKLPFDLSEQTTIATILTNIDQAIGKTEQLIAKYERIKTGLMQDLLTRGIDEQGNIRSEETHEFKDSELGRIPVEWEVVTLKEACEKIQDGTHFSPETSDDGEYMYITSKNIRFGELDLTKVEYVKEEAHKEIYRRCSVEYGDLLLTKDGANTGNLSLNSIKEQISLLSSVAFLRSRKDYVRNDFLFQFLSSEKAQKIFKDQMSGNAITRITLEKINATQIVVPTIEEQLRIATFLATFDDSYFAEKKTLEKYRHLKISLMQDLLTGKVRVDALINENSTS